MPPSQLKRLKASLREEGLVGPQQSKKQKQKAKGNGSNHDWKVQRQNALRGLREQYNPFEIQHMSRGREKFEVLDGRTGQSQGSTAVKGRPGVTKGLGEQNRRKTLLVEMQRRKKVGGILDKRFGENDPKMTPEERNLIRFTKEQQRKFRNGSAFDLEEGSEEEQHHLTHFGQSLGLNGDAIDDFDETELVLSSEDEPDNAGLEKRRRPFDSNGEDMVETDGPPRKKSKAEVMKEVMAKSKLHKYERQQAKDEDDEARQEIDRELPQLFALLNGSKMTEPTKQISAESDTSIMDAGRAALISGSKSRADRDYDEQLRQMVFDKRSQPTERTKTDDEKATEESRRLKDLEEERLQRMRGDEESDNGQLGVEPARIDGLDVEYNDAEAFGLSTIFGAAGNRGNLDVEDEDDFVIDNDLVTSASEVELSDDEDPIVLQDEDEDEEDREFLGGLLQAKEIKVDSTNISEPVNAITSSDYTTRNLPFTYPCPRSHRDFLDVLEDIPFDALPTVIQRIRALYHPKLNSDNNAKLGQFATVLVDHISYLANDSKWETYSAPIIEMVIRHLHSLAKIYAEEVGKRFRYHLQNLSKTRSTAPTKGDLMILTAISSIFPTSDHFHSVVTPANLCMTRYLAQKLPDSVNDLITGTYISTLCLHYQKISKRYVPEVLNYTLTALYALSPNRHPPEHVSFFSRECPNLLRIEAEQEDLLQSSGSISYFSTAQEQKSTAMWKTKLAKIFLALLEAMADMWKGKSSLSEVLNPALAALNLFTSRSVESKIPESIEIQARNLVMKLERLLAQAKIARRPLELHHHRPVAIKTSIPKFEETYNPDKHYDPDRERAESSKLKAEHKKERKGALRELRKDANFIARETLKEKKERDRKYEEKYKRLVAEIQGEEGREANEYEREKRLRKKKR